VKFHVPHAASSALPRPIEPPRRRLGPVRDTLYGLIAGRSLPQQQAMLLLRAAALALTAATASAAAVALSITQQRSVAFVAGDCDTTGECYPFFRIPALKRAKSGALLAFVEARGGNSTNNIAEFAAESVADLTTFLA
jgi:hypothetical protein